MIVLEKENQGNSMIGSNLDRKIGRTWNLHLSKYWQPMLVIAFDQYFLYRFLEEYQFRSFVDLSISSHSLQPP